MNRCMYTFFFFFFSLVNLCPIPQWHTSVLRKLNPLSTVHLEVPLRNNHIHEARDFKKRRLPKFILLLFPDVSFFMCLLALSICCFVGVWGHFRRCSLDHINGCKMSINTARIATRCPKPNPRLLRFQRRYPSFSNYVAKDSILRSPLYVAWVFFFSGMIRV